CRSPSEDLRIVAIKLLSFWVQDRSAAPLFAKLALSDASFGVRWEALRAIERDPATGRFCCGVLENVIRNADGARAGQDEAGLAKYASEILSGMGASAQQHYRRLLTSPGPRARLLALQTVGRLGGEAFPLLPLVVDCGLTAPDDDERDE